jgi:ATP-dependent Zn protease
LVPYTARERRATAYHEAGHAVACLVLGLPFKYVTIKPATDKRGSECGGHVCYDFGRLTKAATLKMWTRERKLAHATQLLCGGLAEDYAQRRWRHQIDNTECAESDLMLAGRLIHLIHRPDKATKAQQRDAGRADINLAFDRAEALVKDNFQKIRKIALALQERVTLTFDEIVTLIG